MTEVFAIDEQFDVFSDDGDFIGFVWQSHKFWPPHHLQRTGTADAWAAETASGERQWFRTREEALEWLGDSR